MTQILENTAVNGSPSEWGPSAGRKFHIAISKDENGIYSIVALNLPGAGSCGSTPEEALTNFEEAARGVIEAYEEASEEIPWKNATKDDIPVGADRKWIILNV